MCAFIGVPGYRGSQNAEPEALEKLDSQDFSGSRFVLAAPSSSSAPTQLCSAFDPGTMPATQRIVCGVVGATGLIGSSLVAQILKQAPHVQDTLRAQIAVVRRPAKMHWIGSGLSGSGI
jgi:hypothetical protein